ncbi:MAG: nuclear transport factor 2 family protein [Gemmatimonadaceae bacterium]|nr:nuclear transport factor 2 family protein [Gemmatimonadaceae bacterium]
MRSLIRCISFYTFAGGMMLASPLAASAQPGSVLRPVSDSASIAETAARFHLALRNGDSATAKSLLAPDIVVLESGQIENRADYIRHHLPADIEAAQSITSTRKLLSVTRQQDVAWVVSSSTSTGSFHGRAINSVGAELMILSKSDKQWRIRAVHWSSARRTTPAP